MQKTIHCWSKFPMKILSHYPSQLYFFQIISQSSGFLWKLFPLKCSLVPLEEQFWFYIDQKTAWPCSFEKHFAFFIEIYRSKWANTLLLFYMEACNVHIVLSKESKEKCFSWIFCMQMFVFSIFYNLSLFLTYISLASICLVINLQLSL